MHPLPHNAALHVMVVEKVKGKKEGAWKIASELELDALLMSAKGTRVVTEISEISEPSRNGVLWTASAV